MSAETQLVQAFLEQYTKKIRGQDYPIKGFRIFPKQRTRGMTPEQVLEQMVEVNGRLVYRDQKPRRKYSTEQEKLEGKRRRGREHYQRNRKEEIRKVVKYQKENRVMTNTYYGRAICLVCNRVGYLYSFSYVNKNSGHESQPYFTIHHRQYKDGECIKNRSHYLGTSDNFDLERILIHPKTPKHKLVKNPVMEIPKSPTMERAISNSRVISALRYYGITEKDMEYGLRHLKKVVGKKYRKRMMEIHPDTSDRKHAHFKSHLTLGEEMVKAKRYYKLLKNIKVMPTTSDNLETMLELDKDFETQSFREFVRY